MWVAVGCESLYLLAKVRLAIFSRLHEPHEGDEQGSDKLVLGYPAPIPRPLWLVYCPRCYGSELARVQRCRTALVIILGTKSFEN